MEAINAYLFDKKSGHDSPNGVWYKAESCGETFFLKKFKQPKYPMEGINNEVYFTKKRECDEWLKSKRKLIDALNELGNGTGNIISPRHVFRENKCFYQATYWIDVQTDSLDQIKKYSFEDKIMLLKTYSAALKKVHSKNIIHGDLKPDNILIGKSSLGKPVAKLIDFDDSYFSEEAPPPELTTVTDAYQSPELAAYKQGHTEYRSKLTCASDVFASGIIFHQFWCGDMPKYPGLSSGRFLYEAIAAAEEYKLNSDIPEWLQNLISAMLLPFPEDRPTMEEVHKAVSNQFFESKIIAKSADLTTLNKVLECIPKDLSLYTDESAAMIFEIYDKILKVRHKANQGVINALTKSLFEALKNLTVKNSAAAFNLADYSTIDKILSMLPSNFSAYTAESATKLQKVVGVINKNRNLTSQTEVDQLTRILYKAVKSLEKVTSSSQQELVPASMLPSGYSEIVSISNDKVCVCTTSGTKMTIPVSAAISLGLVTKKGG